MKNLELSEVNAEAPLCVNTRDGVCRIRLNQPGRFNPLSMEVIAAFQAAVDQAGQDSAVRVLLIEATGRAFCAGHDLQQMREHPEKAYQQRLFQNCGRLMQSLVALPQPVIARVQGVATAAGCQLVASCDLAVASRAARFAVSGINLGLFCSTPAVALSRKVSRNRALEMLFTGEFIDAETAKTEGLVNRVVEEDALDAEIDALITTLKSKPARSLALGKKLFHEQLTMPLEQAYQLAGDVMACNMMYDEAQAGIDGFLNKSPPGK